MAYAAHTATIREEKLVIKAIMRLFNDEDGFCETPWGDGDRAPDESCIRRAISKRINEVEMCSVCQQLWPHVNARYIAKRQRSMLLRKINAIGNRMLKKKNEEILNGEVSQ